MSTALLPTSQSNSIFIIIIIIILVMGHFCSVSSLFVFCLFLYNLIERWRTTISMSFWFLGLLNTFSNLFVVVYYIYQHLPCIVAIVDCYTNISTCRILLLNFTHVGSATASFKDLITVCRGELHQPNSRFWY